MIHSRRRVAAFLAAAAMVISSCGGDSDTDTSPTDAPAENAGESTGAETTDAPVESSGESIEVMAQWGGPEQAGFEQVAAIFTEQTGIGVSYVSERELTSVLPTRIAGGNPPDIAMISRPGQIQSFVDDGVAVSYNELGVDLDAINSSYSESVIDLGTFNDDLYGLLAASNSKSTFWYKPPSFAALGVEEPETWDELVSIAAAYVDNGQTPLALGGLDGWTLTDWFENIYLRVAGPDMYNDLFVTHDVEWTDPTVVTAMEEFRDLIAPVDERVLGGASGANSTGFIDAWDQVLNGDAEMYYEGGFMGNFARENFPDLVGGTDYTFFAFPEIDAAYGKPVVGGGDFAVAFENSPEVTAFIDFLATTEASEAWAQAGNGARITPNINASAELFSDPLTAREAATIKAADIFVFDGSDLAPSAVGGDAMFVGLQMFIENPDDIMAALEFIEAAADSAY